MQGEIQALNEILKSTVYRHQGEGGTTWCRGTAISRTNTRCSIPRHGGDRPRPRESDDRRRRDAGASEGRPRHRRLRHAVRREHRPVDHGDVREAVYDSLKASTPGR